MHDPTPADSDGRNAWRVALIGAILLPCLYLTNLTEPFDFVDDGAIVYPLKSNGPMQWLEQIWRLTLGEFEGRGLFRPTMWLFYKTIDVVVGANAFEWRLTWIFWGMLAAVGMLTLLRELRVGPLAAFTATSIAMWSTFRNEIWMAFGLTEAIAMPFAMLSLICALRAGRSSSIGWDLLGFLCSILMVGTKNVFAAVIPAQVFLRVAAGEATFTAGLRSRWPIAVVWSLPLLLPVIHLLFFLLYWRTGSYVLGTPRLRLLLRTLQAYLKAESYQNIGLGLVLAAAVLILSQSRRPSQGWLSALSGVVGQIRARYRLALIAGGLLLACGLAIYVPVRVTNDSIPGRYTMPAVWGLDIVLAAFLSTFFAAPASKLKSTASVALFIGLVITAATTVVRTDKTAARARLLNDVLEYVEANAPSPSCLGWAYGDQLGEGEGIHFQWHLIARRRADVELAFHDVNDHWDGSCGPTHPAMIMLVSGQPELPAGLGECTNSAKFERRYWFGIYRAYVWKR